MPPVPPADTVSFGTAPTSPATTREDHRFPCEQCGADYRFAPAQGALICDHCGHEQPLSDSPWGGTALKEMDFRSALRAQLPEAEMEITRVSSCPNCAAQVEFDPSVHALECPFCATPVVADTGENRHIKPKGVLPFQFDERAAHEAMEHWLGRLWFAPNGLRDYARRGRKMDGIYIPYWTYDAQTHSRYTGQRGTEYTVNRTVMVDGKPQIRTEIKVRWSNTRGRVQRFFDDVLVLASSSLPRNHTEGLEPWDLSQLSPYQPKYLAGFRAEAYTIDLESGFADARAKMDRVIERDIRFDIGGDRQRINSVDTDISAVTFKHILLPVWMAAYKYRGKSYRFIVNGQSGRVQGERPYSAWKIAAAVALGLIVAALVAYIASQN
ncbi:MAG: primosomal protein N' (replication factor Y) - superfamily II helicase [Alphaproteobacteria bacterium MedPE-SWcel]|nr:MAG: primosomal protein N' (replication factor Y) - superfamily II helicase [Alphaproteobacteria bacterium MedPE-SWcel]